jgi:hypothetical protein
MVYYYQRYPYNATKIQGNVFPLDRLKYMINRSLMPEIIYKLWNYVFRWHSVSIGYQSNLY